LSQTFKKEEWTKNRKIYQKRRKGEKKGRLEEIKKKGGLEEKKG